MSSRLLVAATMLLVAAGAQAAGKSAVYIAPYAGYTHLRIDDGQIPFETGTLKADALQVGFSFGIRIPAGLLIEAGRSDAIHTDFFFGDEADIDLRSYYGVVGWRIPFGDGWHFTPKLGRGKWKLSSSDIDWFGLEDEGHEINGWDNFYELSLSREINDRISLGVNFKDVDAQFGHSRSGTFVASFAF